MDFEFDDFLDENFSKMNNEVIDLNINNYEEDNFYDESFNSKNLSLSNEYDEQIEIDPIYIFTESQLFEKIENNNNIANIA